TPATTSAGAVGVAGTAQVTPQPAYTPKFAVDPQFTAQYQGQLNSYLATRTGNYAVAAVDLTTGATLSADANSQYRAASVNKLELIVDLYRRAAAHQVDLDATTTISASDLQNYGTGTIQLKGPGQVYSWRDLASLMIEESDNTAAYVIGNYLGLDS